MHMRISLSDGKKRTKWLVLICSLTCMVLVGLVPISAQAASISIGENRTGEVSAASPAAEFTLTSPELRSARVQVLAISAGFAPFFTVIDATNGVPVLEVGVSGEATIIQGDVTLAAGAIYIIQVQSANGVFGQFVLSVQQGPPVQPARPLTIGQPVAQTISGDTRGHQYSFAADPVEILLLSVASDETESGPNIVLRDAVTGQTLAASGSRLVGASFRIPIGADSFIIEVTSSGSLSPQPYSICLETESAAIRCPGTTAPAATQPPAPTETLLPTVPGFTPAPIAPGGPCSLAPGGASAVNVRSGPSTSTAIVTQLGANTIVPVIGRLADNTWYQISIGGITGWVSATVARIGGVCGAVTVITFPTATPTITATSEFTATPTTTSTSEFTATPTTTSTPTTDATFTPTSTLPAFTEALNASLPAVYGTTSLASGFVPDPFTVGVTGGGPVSVGYLGGGCTGFTTAAPTFSVNYTSGAFPILRFYFSGGGDTTMIINTPGGSYVCVDDSFGTLNPTIDFNSPSGGRYDVWIGAFSEGSSYSGTLFVTESTANHP